MTKLQGFNTSVEALAQLGLSSGCGATILAVILIRVP